VSAGINWWTVLAPRFHASGSTERGNADRGELFLHEGAPPFQPSRSDSSANLPTHLAVSNSARSASRQTQRSAPRTDHRPGWTVVPFMVALGGRGRRPTRDGPRAFACGPNRGNCAGLRSFPLGEAGSRGAVRYLARGRFLTSELFYADPSLRCRERELSGAGRMVPQTSAN